MDINQALIYYGSDQAKQDFLVQQEIEKKRLIMEGQMLLRNDSVAEYVAQRNITEYKKKGQRPTVDPSVNLFIPANTGEENYSIS
jgi:hypothetical protein